MIKEQAPHAHTAVIGNKQDLDEALKPAQIEKIIGLKTYSMIAKDAGNRDKMIQIIADILEMSAEVSPLLRPLLERDQLTLEATQALESADFSKAALLFEKISDLCIELGDDSLGKEFYEKSGKIKQMLKTVGAPETPSAPKAPPSSATPATPPGPAAPATPPGPAAPATPPGPAAPATPPGPAAPATPPGPAAPKSPTMPPGPKLEVNLQMPKVPQPQTNGEEVLIKPKMITNSSGLSLNPEDFMIKQRPKSISVVPKDARNLLKTSPFQHVTNPTTVTQVAAPVSPTKLIQPRAPATPMPPAPPAAPTKIIQSKAPATTAKPEIPAPPATPPGPAIPAAPATPALSANPAQQGDLQKTLMDLKIKKANIQKMGLDFDMQELSGEITAEVLAQKKLRLDAMEKQIDIQIADLEKFL